MNTKESRLEVTINKAWCKETSSDPDNWTPDNPAYGQCAVTAVVVNDYLEGDIVWALVVLPDGKEVSHYFNLIGGVERDLTRKQFPKGTIVPKRVPKTKGSDSTRDYILSYEPTTQRYEALKTVVDALKTCLDAIMG